MQIFFRMVSTPKVVPWMLKWDLCWCGFQIGLCTWQFMESEQKLFDNSSQLSYSSSSKGVIPSTLRLFSATMTWDPRKLAKLKLLRCRKKRRSRQVQELLREETSQLRGYQSLWKEPRMMYGDYWWFVSDIGIYTIDYDGWILSVDMCSWVMFIYDRCILCCKDSCKSFKSFGPCKWWLWNFEGNKLATPGRCWQGSNQNWERLPSWGIQTYQVSTLEADFPFPQGGINVGFWRIPHFEIYFYGWLISLKCAMPKNWSCFCEASLLLLVPHGTACHASAIAAILFALPSHLQAFGRLTFAGPVTQGVDRSQSLETLGIGRDGVFPHQTRRPGTCTSKCWRRPWTREGFRGVSWKLKGTW